MSILSKLSKVFGRREIHIYVHIDGQIQLDDNIKTPTPGVDRKKSMPSLNVNLANIPIPDVEFGKEEK